MSKLHPVNGHVILKPVEEGETTYGNIVLPDLGKEKPEMGEVVATSSTFNWHTGQDVLSKLSVGDKVLSPKLGAMKITVEGEDYYITKETEVLAKVG